jgi:hypothetical protein
MHQFARILLLLTVVPAVYFFVYWLPFAVVPLEDRQWFAGLVALLCAALAGRFLWTHTGSHARHQGVLASMLTGALILGGIGFGAGFFGPLLLSPGSNQGPLLGLLFTGPLGTVLGAVAGLVYWWLHRDRPQP